MTPATADCEGAVAVERWTAHDIRHNLEHEALVLARESVDRRLEAMNELRLQITTERGNYLTRIEYDAKHEGLVTRLTTAETSLAGLTGRLTVVAALAGVIVSAIVTIALKTLPAPL